MLYNTFWYQPYAVSKPLSLLATFVAISYKPIFLPFQNQPSRCQSLISLHTN